MHTITYEGCYNDSDCRVAGRGDLGASQSCFSGVEAPHHQHLGHVTLLPYGGRVRLVAHSGHACPHVHAHVHIHMHTHMHAHVYVHMHAHMHAPVQMPTCMLTCMPTTGMGAAQRLVFDGLFSSLRYAHTAL